MRITHELVHVPLTCHLLNDVLIIIIPGREGLVPGNEELKARGKVEKWDWEVHGHSWLSETVMINRKSNSDLLLNREKKLI